MARKPRPVVEQELYEIPKNESVMETRVSITAPNPPPPAWLGMKKVPPEWKPYLRETPLETIATLLLDHDTKLYDFVVDDTNLRIEFLPSSKLFRLAFRQLRLDAIEPNKLAELRKLQREVKRQQAQLDKLEETIPREAIREDADG